MEVVGACSGGVAEVGGGPGTASGICDGAAACVGELSAMVVSVSFPLMAQPVIAMAATSRVAVTLQMVRARNSRPPISMKRVPSAAV